MRVISSSVSMMSRNSQNSRRPDSLDRGRGKCRRHYHLCFSILARKLQPAISWRYPARGDCYVHSVSSTGSHSRLVLDTICGYVECRTSSLASSLCPLTFYFPVSDVLLIRQAWDLLHQSLFHLYDAADQDGTKRSIWLV